MDELTFDSIRAQWDSLKTGNPIAIKNQVPGLINLSTVFIKRIDENPQYLTVEFKGFENAVQDTNKDIPLLKRAIQQWLRRFTSSVQAQRTDGSSMIMRLSRIPSQPVDFNSTQINMSKPIIGENKYERQMPRYLTNIIAVKTTER
jgi:hypothetical protein